MTTPPVQHAVDAAFREERGRVVATLILRTGDWDLAEGCAHEAFTGAQRRWPADGIPQRPSAWYGHAEWVARIQPQQYSAPALGNPGGLPDEAQLDTTPELGIYKLPPLAVPLLLKPVLAPIRWL